MTCHNLNRKKSSQMYSFERLCNADLEFRLERSYSQFDLFVSDCDITLAPVFFEIYLSLLLLIFFYFSVRLLLSVYENNIGVSLIQDGIRVVRGLRRWRGYVEGCSWHREPPAPAHQFQIATGKSRADTAACHTASRAPLVGFIVLREREHDTDNN